MLHEADRSCKNAPIPPAFYTSLHHQYMSEFNRNPVSGGQQLYHPGLELTACDTLPEPPFHIIVLLTGGIKMRFCHDLLRPYWDQNDAELFGVIKGYAVINA